MSTLPNMNTVHNGDAPPRQFIVFSIGDSRRPSTWSNVPYFFTRELEHQGCQVERIDIGPPRSVQLLFDVPWKAWCRLTGVRTKYTFQRSMVNRRATQARISRALRQHRELHCIFMTFSFSTREKARPYTLFCDQSFAQHIAYFDERSPDHLEYPTVLEERRNMEEAGIIVALFPDVAEDLRYAYGEKVKYFGNVVNIELPAGETEAALNVKRATNEIVFIGSRKYKAGLERLAEAIDFLNQGLFAGLVVNVIGMKRKDMPTAPANMVFHGYLDKGKPTELRRYTDILSRARLFVNPNPKWAAFSASCEAMFLYTPVVLFPYPEFERTFGTVDNVGIGLQSTLPQHIAESIAGLMRDDAAWQAKAIAAHHATESMTWANFTRKFMRESGG